MKMAEIEQVKIKYFYSTTILFADPVEITFAPGQTLLTDSLMKFMGMASFNLTLQTVRIASTEDTVEITEGAMDFLHKRIFLERTKPAEIYVPLTGETLLVNSICLYPDFELNETFLARDVLDINLSNGNMLYITRRGIAFCKIFLPNGEMRYVYRNGNAFREILFYPTGSLKELNLSCTKQYWKIHSADGTTKKVDISKFSLNETGTIFRDGENECKIKNIYRSDTPNIQAENTQLKE